MSADLFWFNDEQWSKVKSHLPTIRQKVSQSDRAAMAGIARENVSRIMNNWMRAKVVTRLSGYYCLENAKKLQSEIDV